MPKTFYILYIDRTESGIPIGARHRQFGPMKDLVAAEEHYSAFVRKDRCGRMAKEVQRPRVMQAIILGPFIAPFRLTGVLLIVASHAVVCFIARLVLPSSLGRWVLRKHAGFCARIILILFGFVRIERRIFAEPGNST